MDSKIRIKTAAKPLKEQRAKTIWIRLILLVLIPYSLFLIPSCKQNNWVDWKVQNEMWLEANKTKDSVVVTPSGLQYKIIADPLKDNGEARPNLTSTVTCDYRVSLINGNVIEYQGPTFGGDKSVTLSLASTINGFAEGCHHIHNNGDIEFYIPAYLGYDYAKFQSDDYNKAEGFGTEGITGYIPPYSTLIYEVHLCGISD